MSIRGVWASAGLAACAIVGFAVVALFAFVVGGESQGTDPVTPTRLSPEEVSDWFNPGNPWDGKGAGNSTLEDLVNDTSQPNPLLWLGDSFEGYNLQAIVRQEYQGPDGRQVNATLLIYGGCELQGKERPTCTPPLQVRLDRICHATRDQVADAVALERTTLRGVEGRKFRDGHFALWAGERLISVTAPGQPELAERAVSGLRSVDGSGELQPGTALPQPDFSQCK